MLMRECGQDAHPPQRVRSEGISLMYHEISPSFTLSAPLPAQGCVIWLRTTKWLLKRLLRKRKASLGDFHFSGFRLAS